jgi:hypothetical protein
MIPRKAPAPECEPLLVGLPPIVNLGGAMRVGVVSDALLWLDRNVNLQRARPDAKPGQSLYMRLLSGANPDGSRLHVHTMDYPEDFSRGAHPDSYDLFTTVVRGACWVVYTEGQGAARREVERLLETGNIVFKPAGANLTIATRPGQTARLLMVEITAARK